MKYKRILLKISGEALAGPAGYGLDGTVLKRIAEEIKEVRAAGVEIGIVCGGGNMFRGAVLSERGIDRARADYMGMLSTVINCLALQDFLEREGIVTRVQSAIAMGQVAEPYLPLRAIRHMEKGRAVIFGAGLGAPYFSTDTAAAQRALEVRAEAVLSGGAQPLVDPGTELRSILPDRADQRFAYARAELAYSLACHLVRWCDAPYDGPVVTELFEAPLASRTFRAAIPRDPELRSAKDQKGYLALVEQAQRIDAAVKEPATAATS